MSITFFCPHCGHRYSLADSHAGKKAKCKCGQVITVPDIERSPAGVRIVKNEPKAPEPVAAATPYLEQIQAHIDRHIGPAPMVFHEIISEYAHVDLHIIPPQPRIKPSKARPMGGDYFTIVTSGLSAKPMNVSPQARKAGISPYAELMLALPKNWPGFRPDGTFDDHIMEDERNWWPLRWLKQLARMPEEYDTFFCHFVTVPNGEDAAPFVPGISLCCWLLTPPLLCPNAATLRIDGRIEITFYAIMPITRDEMELKLRKGQGALVEAIDYVGLFELVNPTRKSILKPGARPR